MGDELAIANATACLPDVFGHNIEVVPRLFPDLRPQGDYRRSLNLLAFVKKMYPHMPVKSGLMAGFGETIEEIHEALSDLRSAGCDMVTVGQYLQPSKQSAPVERYLHPDEFASIEKEAFAMGFSSAVCGPLVRSSYHAEASASKCIS